MTTHEAILAHDGLHETIRELRTTKAELLEACKAAAHLIVNHAEGHHRSFIECKNILVAAIQKAEPQP